LAMAATQRAPAGTAKALSGRRPAFFSSPSGVSAGQHFFDSVAAPCVVELEHEGLGWLERISVARRHRPRRVLSFLSNAIGKLHLGLSSLFRTAAFLRNFV